MKILITGGLGHIGSKLIKELLFKTLPKDFFNSPENELVVADNFLTQRYCSLFNLPAPIKFLDKCISEITTSELEDIDTVIHLAASTNAEASFNNKKQTEEINLELTKTFIDKCEQSKCRFIFPSSTSVYGTSAETVHEDDDAFLNPQSPYADTKIKIEKRLEKYDGDYLILRFGTIFGVSPGMRFHTAINKFCYEASLGKSLTVWKENYKQYRPYLGINDAISALCLFLNNNDCSWNTKYNALTDNFKLSDIINYIQSRIPAEINMVNTPLLNQFSYKVSDSKIKFLGFEPRDNLHNSIRETLSLLKNLNGQS